MCCVLSVVGKLLMLSPWSDRTNADYRERTIERSGGRARREKTEVDVLILNCEKTTCVLFGTSGYEHTGPDWFSRGCSFERASDLILLVWFGRSLLHLK